MQKILGRASPRCEPLCNTGRRFTKLRTVVNYESHRASKPISPIKCIKCTFTKSLETMACESLRRESLLAAWQAIGPAQHLTDELQSLLLTYMNRSSTGLEHGTTCIKLPLNTNTRKGPIPPPQRFLRRTRNGDSAPAGPSKAIEHLTTNAYSCLESERLNGCWQLVAPDGPPSDFSQHDIGEESALAFEANHTKSLMKNVFVCDSMPCVHLEKPCNGIPLPPEDGRTVKP